MTDNINPSHYRQHAHECIEFTQYLNFNLGNAFKYIWRHKEKNGREDLEKAVWYLERQRDDAPEFKKLKNKRYSELFDKLCLIDFDMDTHSALGAILYAATDCTEDNISWALACVKDLLKKMPSGSPMPSENTPNPERK
ncbi:DUF3310 domain-containing protein [Neisseria lactamica]|uniref:DUF3310 domain-containing protein n=1 Tax=Neisseria lactamica TaxID=486 RepID=UPI000E57E6A1|nr:DUF3310 domain-containing protein [Neisseria lactamica]